MVATKPEADFIPGQEPLQEDGSRKAKFQPESPVPFDPTQHTRNLGKATYIDVKWRLVWARQVHDDLQIITECLKMEPGFAFFKATASYIDRDDRIIACTGHGSETKEDFPDYIEKAETKAIGRALSFLGFGAADLPEDTRIVDSPVEPRKGPTSSANPKKVSEASGQERIFTAAKKQLVQQMRRTGASPTRMNAIALEEAGITGANNLDLKGVQAVLTYLSMVRDNAYDPSEIVVPELVDES